MSVSNSNESAKPATPRSWLQSHFRVPRGWVGRWVGWFMSRENRRMNRLTVGLLHVAEDDDVLEIGFGPGHAIELLVTHTAARTIAGIDVSDVMVQQALARNDQAVAAGRVMLLMGTVQALPFADGQFSKVFAVSNFRIWDNRREALQEIHRVLRPGGRLVLSLRRAEVKPHWWSSPGLTPRQLAEDVRLIEGQSFRNVRTAKSSFVRRTVCIVAEK